MGFIGLGGGCGLVRVARCGVILVPGWRSLPALAGRVSCGRVLVLGVLPGAAGE